jgi:restriction endonuclease S subunit
MIVSEITYNQAIERLRFDAEFYKPEYLEAEEMVKKIHKIKTIGNLAESIVNGVEIREYFSEGIPYLRVSDMKEVFVDISKVSKVRANSVVTKDIKLDEGDLLFSRSGTLGIICIVTSEIKDSIISSHLIRVRLKKINPFYAAIYFNCKYGRLQILRRNNGAVVPEIDQPSLKTIFIPIPSPSFQQNIESLVKESYKKRKEADEKYKEAESLLNKTLGIEKLELKEEKIFETRFDEVENVLRFDAEHYQPKYRQVKEFIGKSGYEVKKLREVIEISNKKIEPSSQPTQLFNYIELANINPSTGEIEEVTQVIGHNAPSRARMLVKKGDVLVSSLLGSLDNIGLVPDELDNSVASTGFFVIRSKTFLPEFLFLLFKSNLIKLQLEEKTAGAIMSAVPKTTFGDLLIPIVSEQIQKQISDLVKQSFSLRKESKELLKEAKKKVEGFIEKNSNHSRQ